MRRKGVSTYIEVFVLIGIATGGSALAYSAVGRLGASSSGPSFGVTDQTIRQGTNAATERMTVTNTGQTGITSFKVYPGVASAYCVSVSSVSSGAVLSTTCPATSNVFPVALSVNLDPGASVVFVLFFPGAAVFQVGSAYPVTLAAGSATLGGRAVALPA
ncbi:MAG: hypothetical protein HY296_01020 [Thaumarchaeota archaeon]|nr:hypothetical protein [Nitrososphaerota archaeon]